MGAWLGGVAANKEAKRSGVPCGTGLGVTGLGLLTTSPWPRPCGSFPLSLSGDLCLGHPMTLPYVPCPMVLGRLRRESRV